VLLLAGKLLVRSPSLCLCLYDKKGGVSGSVSPTCTQRSPCTHNPIEKLCNKQHWTLTLTIKSLERDRDDAWGRRKQKGAQLKTLLALPLEVSHAAGRPSDPHNHAHLAHTYSIPSDAIACRACFV
jgi:hypothetical protein